MFKRRTVLIVGAGASKEVELPVGTELANIISRLLQFEHEFGRITRGDHSFHQSILRLAGSQPHGPYFTAAKQISRGVQLAGSIDSYIDLHRRIPEVSAVGKLAIIRSILDAERRSSMFVDREKRRTSLAFEKLQNTWLYAFAHLLTSEVEASELKSIFRNLTIVCFNYDRCIEEFISHWIAALYSIEYHAALEVLAELKMLRPYGSVGQLSDNMPFGCDPNYVDLISSSRGIRTFTEQMGSTEMRDRIREAVTEADTLVCLGFGFHKQNLDLIMSDIEPKSRRVFCSAFGFSNTDVGDIEIDLMRRLRGPNVSSKKSKAMHVRNDLKCGGVFQEFKRALFSGD